MYEFNDHPPKAPRLAMPVPEVSQLGHAAKSGSIRIAGMKVLKSWPIYRIVLIVLSNAGVAGVAQTTNEDEALAMETRARGYWVDPSSGLMWAAKDRCGTCA